MFTLAALTGKLMFMAALALVMSIINIGVLYNFWSQKSQMKLWYCALIMTTAFYLTGLYLILQIK